MGGWGTQFFPRHPRRTMNLIQSRAKMKLPGVYLNLQFSLTFVDRYLKPPKSGGPLSVDLSWGFDQDGCSLLVLLGGDQFPLLAFTDWEYHANYEERLFYIIKKSSTSNNLHLLRGLLALLLHGLVALLAHRGGFLHDVAHLYKCKKFPQYSSLQPTFVSSFFRASPSSLVSEDPKTPS